MAPGITYRLSPGVWDARVARLVICLGDRTTCCAGSTDKGTNVETSKSSCVLLSETPRVQNLVAKALGSADSRPLVCEFRLHNRRTQLRESLPFARMMYVIMPLLSRPKSCQPSKASSMRERQVGSCHRRTHSHNERISCVFLFCPSGYGSDYNCCIQSGVWRLAAQSLGLRAWPPNRGKGWGFLFLPPRNPKCQSDYEVLRR